MIERIIILDSVDPVVFFGVNNANIQLIKTLFPKLRLVARGNVMKVIGEEQEIDLFEEKVRLLEKYASEYNVLGENVIIDVVKGDMPVENKQNDLIIYGVNANLSLHVRRIKKNWQMRLERTIWFLLWVRPVQEKRM